MTFAASSQTLHHQERTRLAFDPVYSGLSTKYRSKNAHHRPCCRPHHVFARTIRPEKRELSNADLARLLDLPESSCSDLLPTLHELGYLLRTGRSRSFYPTARLL